MIEIFDIFFLILLYFMKTHAIIIHIYGILELKIWWLNISHQLLITNSHEWDILKLLDIFTSNTIQQSIPFPILKHPTQDTLVWYQTGSEKLKAQDVYRDLFATFEENIDTSRTFSTIWKVIVSTLFVITKTFGPLDLA